MWTLEALSIDLALAQRFTIARESWDVAPNVFVVLRYGDAVGRGEASPASRWRESVESVLAELKGVEPAEALTDPFDLEGVAEVLEAGSARAALDIALHDLAGSLAGISVSELLGTTGREPPPTSVTLPITDIDEMAQRAKRLAGHPIVKVKVGFDGDIDAVAAIRGSFDGAIRIDANEGWNSDEAIERLNAIARFDIELCEQPVPAGDLDVLKHVRAESPIPIFADEDVCTAADVARLVGVVDGVNLKLRKAGGIREVVKGISVARAHGMGVMIGCDLESGIAATAGAHVAPLADFVDLDGPLLLARDPFPGVRYDAGRLIRPEGPGLGVLEVPG
jgi:L-Ala-D/L-Glu epimerase